MKQTEIGLIPDDWEVKRLNAICNNISSGKNQNRFVNGIYPVYGSTGIIGFCNNNKYSGDAILVARVGANAGLVNKVAGKYDVSDNTLVIQSDKCDIDYLSRLLAFRNLNQLIFGSGQPLITGGQLKALLIQLPSLTEQQRIAKALSDVDALIFTTEKLLQKKKNIKQGTMQELLTGKKRLPGFAKSNNTKMTELGEIPEDWEVNSIKDFAKVYDGTHQTPHYVDVGIPFYSVENVTANDFEHTKLVSEKEHRFLTSKVKIEKGDILMTRIGSIGDCKYIDWEPEASFYVSLALIKCDTSVDARFISYYSNSLQFKKELELRSLITAIPQKINLGPISEIILVLPPKEEQTAIANVLSSMDKEIETLNTKLEKYRNLKTAMMQQLLTGKIRLK